MIYRVVTFFLYRRIGDEMVTVYFQSIALKYRISNNLSARYEKFLGLANQTMRRKPSMIYFCVRLSSNASRKGLTSCMSRPGQTALRRNLLRDNQKRCREVLHRTDRKRGCVSGDHSFAPPSMAKANTITIFSSTLWRFEGLRLAFRQTLRNCSWRRRKQGMPGHRDSLRKAFRGWKSCRRRIPIIYRRNHPSPLLQSGSGAVFVAERAVSVTPYRKTISPQTTQLLFLSLSLSKIGIIDGFLSDKSIREIGKFIKYNIISDFHSDFHRGGDFVMGEF